MNDLESQTRRCHVSVIKKTMWLHASDFDYSRKLVVDENLYISSFTSFNFIISILRSVFHSNSYVFIIISLLQMSACTFTKKTLIHSILWLAPALRLWSKKHWGILHSGLILQISHSSPVTVSKTKRFDKAIISTTNWRCLPKTVRHTVRKLLDLIFNNERQFSENLSQVEDSYAIWAHNQTCNLAFIYSAAFFSLVFPFLHNLFLFDVREAIYKKKINK